MLLANLRIMVRYEVSNCSCLAALFNAPNIPVVKNENEAKPECTGSCIPCDQSEKSTERQDSGAFLPACSITWAAHWCTSACVGADW